MLTGKIAVVTGASGKTLAPVVVKPEMTSNSASSKSGISPLRKNGSAPKKLRTIQLMDTATKPSFA